MNNIENADSRYDIRQLSLITGLTDRTLRNYINSGVLRGEKIDGAWRFTEEQIQGFVSDPAVLPSIRAKKNAAVFDFLKDTKKQKNRCCIILDIPEGDGKAASRFFCNAICNGGYSDISFSFESVKCVPRIIVTGNTQEVLELVNRYHDLS